VFFFFFGEIVNFIFEKEIKFFYFKKK